MIYKIIQIAFLLFCLGCTTVTYNGGDIIIKEIDYPPIGKTVTVYIGDYLVRKGTINEEIFLIIHKAVSGARYTIPDKKYSQVGSSSTHDFFLLVVLLNSLGWIQRKHYLLKNQILLKCAL